MRGSNSEESLRYFAKTCQILSKKRSKNVWDQISTFTFCYESTLMDHVEVVMISYDTR